MKTMEIEQKYLVQYKAPGEQNVCLVTMQWSNKGSLGSKQHGNIRVPSVSHQLHVDIMFKDV